MATTKCPLLLEERQTSTTAMSTAMLQQREAAGEIEAADLMLYF
jgi:hypothetical protein